MLLVEEQEDGHAAQQRVLELWEVVLPSARGYGRLTIAMVT
jgi:hypothetical protein